MSEGLDPRLLLRGYAAGIFPMADSRDADDIFWVEPRNRAIIPLDGFHLSRSLAKRVRSGRFTVTRDRAFAEVMLACADREETWINQDIERATLGLHAVGHAHSIECWHEGRAGRRALRRQARPRLLRRSHVQPHDRRIEGRAGLAGRAAEGRRFHPARLPVHDRPSRLAGRDDGQPRSLCRIAVGGVVSAGGRGRAAGCFGRFGRVGRLAIPRLDGLPPPDFDALDRLLEGAGAAGAAGPAGQLIAQLLGQTS